MERITLTDGSGRWFSPDSATCYRESQTWDGQNYISDATGSQWDHEMIYVTRGGRYILHWWSQWQGSRASYVEVSRETACRWLLSQGNHDAARQLAPELVADLAL